MSPKLSLGHVTWTAKKRPIRREVLSQYFFSIISDIFNVICDIYFSIINSLAEVFLVFVPQQLKALGS